MPRPQKQTVEYFSHDANAGQGRTLSILYNQFGHDGISAWWLLLELLSRTKNHVVSIRNGEDTEFLAATLHFKPKRLKDIFSKMAELDAIDPQLFKCGVVWCQNFVDRLEPVYQKRGQALPRKPELSTPELSTPETELSTPETELSTPETELSTPEIPQSKESKVKRVKKVKSSGIQSFGEFKNSLKVEYPGLDVDNEWRRCQVWWSEGKREMKRPKTALINWLTKAQKIKTDEAVAGRTSRALPTAEELEKEWKQK